MAKVAGFSGMDSLKVGVGMMTRGEVALIVSQKGLSVGLFKFSLFYIGNSSDYYFISSNTAFIKVTLCKVT